MNINSIYLKRVKKNSELELQFLKKEKIFPIIRLLIVVSGFIVFYNLLSINIYISFLALSIFLTFFAFVLKKESKISSQRKLFSVLKSINEKELSCLNEFCNFYPNGKEYYDNNHSYSSDLDIFGKHSLFQYINRTTLKVSSDILASWLKQPASVEEIKLRQEAILELKDRIDFRQNLFAVGLSHKANENDYKQLLEWSKEHIDFLKGFKIISKILPPVTILSLFFSFFFIPLIIPVSLLIIQLIIIKLTNKKIKVIHGKIGKNVNLLKAFFDIVSLIEKETFISKKLNSLKENFILDDNSFSKRIYILSKILNNLDFRFNILIHPIINSLFLWDIYQIFRLEKWKTKNNSNIEKIFHNIGEFEVLSSFANLKFNNPNWTFPEISNKHFFLSANNIGHPLINEKVRICNNFEINSSGKFALITGSNMSGKSTFLRTIGVNIILAMCGSCVCAEKFTLSPVKVVTSMRIVDSLEENTSTFYAELKRIETILRKVEQKEKVFLLLDEILKGTNSNDRHIGSKALIKQLIKNNGVGIIATHDTTLSNIGSELSKNVDIYNFEVQVQDENLFFDYKLYNGVCTSLNASILMKKIGIKIE